MTEPQALRDPGEVAEAAAGKAAAVNHRYRTLRPLGRGGMGTVYLAVDTARGDRLVALKRIRKDRLDHRGIANLRNEFLALAALRHPNLALAYDFGVDRETDDFFFTSEYVNGIHWLKAVQPLDLSRASGFRAFAELLAQVLRALEFIHSRGLVHGDVKPENVLVTTEVERGDPSGPGLQAKLIDFGLAKREKAAGGKKILGTPYYVAPETILGAQVDRRTDLYSLGAVLYHLATGSQPFRGESNLEILKRHLEEAPAPPHVAAPGVPRPLSEVIARLLEKKPEDRFQGALEVIERLNRTCGLDLPLETPETAASYLEPARLVGRQGALARLRAVFHAATGAMAVDASLEGETEEPLAGGQSSAAPGGEKGAPPGRLVVLRGERGLGKRRLAEELRHTAQTHGASFVELECGRAAAEPPAAPLRLDRELERLADLRERGRAYAFLQCAAAFVERLQGCPEDDPAIEGVLEDMALQIVKTSLDEPAVLMVHDLHLASRPLGRLVEALVQRLADLKGASSRLLLCATALDGSEPEGGDYHRFSGTSLYRSAVEEVQLKRLGGEEVARLIETAFPGFEVPPGFAQRVLEESDGNQEVAIEILSFLIERGKITRTPLGWRLSPDYEGEDVPGKVRRELKERIARLPEDALRLGAACACLGDSCDAKLAACLAGMSARGAASALQVLRSRRILQATGPDATEEHSFVHSSARAILYGRIPPSDLPAMHERAGDLLEGLGEPAGRERLMSLAHHYLLSRSKAKAARYGLQAARELAREASPLEAIGLYERVLAVAGPEDPGLASRVRREIAALRFQVGDHAGALDLLEPMIEPRGAAACAGDAWPVYLEAARAHIRLGQFAQAALLLNRSVRRGKRKESLAQLAPIMFVLAELHHFKGNHVESLRCAGRLVKSKDGIADGSLLSQLYMLLAECHACLNNAEGAADFCQQALRIIESRHDALHLAWSLFCRGKHYSFRHQPAKAVRQLQLALILRKKLGLLEGQADCQRELGAMHLELGSPGEARAALEEALAVYRKTGNVPCSVAALCMLAEACRLQGDHDACQEAAADALRRMEPLEKRRWTLETQLALARSAIDRGEAAKAARYLGEAEGTSTKGTGLARYAAELEAARSELELDRGRLEPALDRVQRAVLLAREAKDPVLLARMLGQEAYLCCQVGKVGQARRLIVPIFDVAKGHDLPQLEGWARMIEGLVLARDGKLDAAEKVFAQAAEALAAHGHERDLVHLQLEHGLLSLQRGSHEQAYLDLEEGLHLAERLDLRRMQCRYQLAMGRLEASIPGGQAARAEQELVAAEKLALEAPFPELAWQIQYHLGRQMSRCGRSVDAVRRFRGACEGLRAIARGLPQALADGYRRATGAEDLEGLVEEEVAVGAAAAAG
ncbi:MAG: protein kinase [Planctomycetes bacterium]|nr:protein kinase [Planctomycetota bacterium]